VRSQHRRTYDVESILSVRETDEYRDAKYLARGHDLRDVAKYWAEKHPENDVTVSKAIEHYKERELIRLLPTTQGNVKSKLKWLDQAIGSRNMAEVDLGDLMKIIDDLPFGPVTRNGYRRFLNRFFSWACEMPHRFIKISPTNGLRSEDEGGGAVEYMPPEDVETFLRTAETMDPGLLPPLILAFFAGIRPYVILRMCPYATTLIDRSDRSILVPSMYDGKVINKTKKGYRIEGILGPLWEWLDAYWDGQAIPTTNFNSRRKRVLALSEIKWPHDGPRHTCGTMLYAYTRDLEKVRSWLGHTDSKTTYKHYVETTARKGEAAQWMSILPQPVTPSPEARRGPLEWPRDDVLRSWRRKMTLNQIAVKVGCTEAAVRKRLCKIGVSR